MLIEIIALILFGILAYQDLKTHKVNNVLIFLLWLPAFMLAPNYLLAAFISLGFVNEVLAHFRSHIVGWGDVLMFGPFVAVMAALGHYQYLMGLFAFGTCLMASSIGKKKLPLGTVFFLIYAITLLVSTWHNGG